MRIYDAMLYLYVRYDMLVNDAWDWWEERRLARQNR